MKLRVSQAYRDSSGAMIIITQLDGFGYLGSGNYYDQFGYAHTDGVADLEYEIDTYDTQPNNAIGWM